MKKLKLISGVAVALLLTAACSAPAPNANTTASGNAGNRNANAGANTAASPAASPAASNANASTSQQQGAAQDFTLVNQTGVEIDKVYISPHDADDWEEDILGKDTLPSGQNVEIKFQREETAAQWDLRIEDKEGNAIEWENLNLLKISKLTLHYDKSSGKATAEAE